MNTGTSQRLRTLTPGCLGRFGNRTWNRAQPRLWRSAMAATCVRRGICRLRPRDRSSLACAVARRRGPPSEDPRTRLDQGQRQTDPARRRCPAHRQRPETGPPYLTPADAADQLRMILGRRPARDDQRRASPTDLRRGRDGVARARRAQARTQKWRRPPPGKSPPRRKVGGAGAVGERGKRPESCGLPQTFGGSAISRRPPRRCRAPRSRSSQMRDYRHRGRRSSGFVARAGRFPAGRWVSRCPCDGRK